MVTDGTIFRTDGSLARAAHHAQFVRDERSLVVWASGTVRAFPLTADLCISTDTLAELVDLGLVRTADDEAEIASLRCKRAATALDEPTVTGLRELAPSGTSMLDVGSVLPVVPAVLPDRWRVDRIDDTASGSHDVLGVPLESFRRVYHYDFAVSVQRPGWPLASPRALRAHLANMAASLRPGGVYLVKLTTEAGREDVSVHTDRLRHVHRIIGRVGGENLLEIDRYIRPPVPWLLDLLAVQGAWLAPRLLDEELVPIPLERAEISDVRWIELRTPDA